MEFVTVKFTMQMMVDHHGDDKDPARMIEVAIEAADKIPVAQLTVDSITRLQLPGVDMKPQIR